MTYKSYRKSYNPAPENTVTSYHACNSCRKEWYSSDNYGFLVCPYCKSYSSISVRLDRTNGAMKLEEFPGMQYSTRPDDSKRSNNTRQARTRGLKELDRVLRFTGVQK